MFKAKSYSEALARRKQGKRAYLRHKDNLSDDEKATRRLLRPLRHAKSDKKRRAKEWRHAVKDRDGWRCQWPNGCQTGDRIIDAHHIAERSLRPDLRYEISNGIALCRTHHDWLPLHRAEAIKLGLLSDETYEAAQKAKNAE